MKFSELLKDHEIVVPPPTKMPVESIQVQPQKVKEKEPDPAEVEKKVRVQLEEEYRQKVSFIQEETKKLLEQMTREQESRFQEREKLMREERQELIRLREELKNQQELMLRSAKNDMQAELAKKVEEEKSRLEAEKHIAEEEKRKAVLEAQRAIEELQRKAAEEKAHFLEKERLFEQKLSEKVEPPSEAPLVSNEAPLVSNETPGFGFSKSMPQAVNPSSGVESIFDDSREVKAKHLYGSMVQAATDLFSQFSKSETPNIDMLSSLIGELVEQLPELDSYLMGLSLDSYAEGNPFVYHSVNCAIFSLVLGCEFNLSDEKMKDLGMAAFLHDVGLVSIMEDLGYPKDLSSQIRKEVLEHPTKGAEMLKPWLSADALAGVKQHHEVGNGKGYPAKLQAAQIHIYANIIHVADCFDALTHPRPYRKTPFDVNDAVKEIIDTGRGIYNRDVLKALMSRIGLYPVMTYVELSNKQVAKVIRQNKQLPVSPTVQIEFDEDGRKLVHPKIVDLSQTQFFHIVGPAKRYARHSVNSSNISSTKSKALSSHRLEISKDIISLALVGIVLLILLYVVVKI